MDLNRYIKENRNPEKTKKLVVYPLLSIKSDKKIISQIYQFLTLFYDLKEKTKIPIDFWTHASKFWFNEHPKEIEKYKNIRELRNNIINKNFDDISILKWMNTYLNFLYSHSQNRDFEKLKIFPNQNGNFCVLNLLHFDSGFPNEFKECIKKIF